MDRLFATTATTYFFFLVVVVQHVTGAPKEPYVYVIYNADSSCRNMPISINGFVSDDPDPIFGGKATISNSSTSGLPQDDGPNATVNGMHLCSAESSCLIDRYSDQCLALERTSVGGSTFSVSPEGLVYQCDETNEDGDCSILDQCYHSSICPHCYFITVLTSQLVKNASLITAAIPERLNPDQAYMMFYGDNQCQSLEGVQGVLAGETHFVMTTEESGVSCEDAIRCVFNGQGEHCQDMLQQHRLTKEVQQNYTLQFGTKDNGRTIVQCQDTASGGAVVSPTSNEADVSVTCETTVVVSGDTVDDQCLPSPIHPKCYYKFVSAKRLFENPITYLGTVNKYADATDTGAASGGANGESTVDDVYADQGKDNGQYEPLPSRATTLTSRTLVRSFSTVLTMIVTAAAAFIFSV